MRNPLADPYLLGVSASVGLVGIIPAAFEVLQVLFRLSKWENPRTCQGKFDQETKDRVVRLVAHSEAMDASPLDVKDVLWNQCPRTLLQKTHGYVEKIKSYATPTSC
ncbi:hypothetical protein BKD78_09195 [Corynebacterium diphtheriae]|nr:hypothetical protein BKD78_09195 [Corynebacterium diphtheriae]